MVVGTQGELSTLQRRPDQLVSQPPYYYNNTADSPVL